MKKYPSPDQLPVTFRNVFSKAVGRIGLSPIDHGKMNELETNLEPSENAAGRFPLDQLIKEMPEALVIGDPRIRVLVQALRPHAVRLSSDKTFIPDVPESYISHRITIMPPKDLQKGAKTEEWSTKLPTDTFVGASGIVSWTKGRASRENNGTSSQTFISNMAHNSDSSSIPAPSAEVYVTKDTLGRWNVFSYLTPDGAHRLAAARMREDAGFPVTYVGINLVSEPIEYRQFLRASR